MSNKNECKLHAQRLCPKDASKGGSATGGGGGGSGFESCECAPWQRYLIYSIPFLLYIPWAVRAMKCPPRCCPPASQCPPPPQPQFVCCPPQPKKPACPKRKIKRKAADKCCAESEKSDKCDD